MGPINIWYGESYKRVLLIGESPHKSWVELGDPFHNSRGNLLPSAKNMEHYLGVLGYSLEEVAITEIVGCYVDDRTKLPKMMINCSANILGKINEADPELVILLGQKTVQAFSEVIGIEIEMLSRFEWNGRKYIALYHPSPINPRNHKRNTNFLLTS